MKSIKAPFLIAALAAGRAFCADVPPAVPAPSADPMAEALPVLESQYGGFTALQYKPGDTLDGLAARSRGELELMPASASAPPPILTAELPDGVTYWRLASFIPKDGWPALVARLKEDAQRQPADGAVLDLRSNETPDDMRGASQTAALFAPGDHVLTRYNLQQADRALISANLPPATPFRGPIVVLTDPRTTGAAEVLAACLKADGAIVVGEATAGRGAAFGEWKLSSGQTLRFLRDRVHVGNGADLWGHPVEPDIAVTADGQAEKAALVLIRDGHIDDVIQESPQRHRMSEAALIQGQDPEYDDYLASLEDRPVLLSLPVIHDAALITALDSLKAIRVSQLDAPQPPPAADAPAAGGAVR